MPQKLCTLCASPRPLLIRCQIDSTQRWHFVCPGTCWRSVSGGVDDAAGRRDEFPWYRYGGMWKDRSEDGPVSAKKPRKVKERQRREKEAKEGDHATVRSAEEGSDGRSHSETHSESEHDTTKVAGG